jgi:hypothetical protein
MSVGSQAYRAPLAADKEHSMLRTSLISGRVFGRPSRAFNEIPVASR